MAGKISNNVVAGLVVLAILISVIGTVLTMNAVAKVAEVAPVTVSSTTGEVKLYIIPKPVSTEGQVNLTVVNQSAT